MDLKEITCQVIDVLGESAVAGVAGVRQQTVSYWKLRSGKIPAEYVLRIESELLRRGVPLTRYEMRPDVYGLKDGATA